LLFQYNEKDFSLIILLSLNISVFIRVHLPAPPA